MAIKFFLIYMGGFLACSILLATMVKKFSVAYAGQGKKPFVYGTFSTFLASIAAFLSTYISNNLFAVFWFVTAIFILFGIVHMIIVHKKYFTPSGNNGAKMVTGEIMFALSVVFFTIVVFSSLQYFLKGRDFLFFPMMMSVLGFFIPLLVTHTFEAAYNIPAPVFKTWEYPVLNPIELPDEVPGERLLVIGFEIAKKTVDSKKAHFRAKAPEGIKLGELYYHFINDYNELQSETTIDFIGPDNRAQHWWFRLKPKWYQGNRVLDPGITVRENGIRENSVIICERIDQ